MASVLLPDEELELKISRLLIGGKVLIEVLENNVIIDVLQIKT